MNATKATAIEAMAIIKIQMFPVEEVGGATLAALHVADISLPESIFTVTVGELEAIAPIQP